MDTPLTMRMRPDGSAPDLEAVKASGGWRGLRRALELTPEEVTAEVDRGKLLGRGGAGFPTGKKWSFAPPPDGGPRYLVCNADEMEPGTFKDRYLLERDPHLLLEGMAIAGYALRATEGVVFLRWAYREAHARLERAIAEAEEAGWLGDHVLGTDHSFHVHVHVSAGRYICGEETALLDGLEGRRPIPRAKPPFPIVSGLFGRPTVVNNVETLCSVPWLVERGADEYLGLSKVPGEGGTKIYGVSGRVARPGLWELPMGTTLGELLHEHAGGMADGYRFRGCLPGGASTDFLVEEHLNVPLAFGTVGKAGSRLGTGTVVVLDDRTCPVGMVGNLEVFFARESCGWCTPCRDGLPWTAKILAALERGDGEPGDLERLALHTRLLGPGRTFCALAPGAMEPLQSALRHFREDFERHVTERRCPFHGEQ